MGVESEALRLARDLKLTLVSRSQSETRMTICSENRHRVIIELRLRHPG
jgi:hypothetical protein